MTALIITGSVLLFILLLLVSPVSLRFSYKNGDMKASAHYLFIKLDFSPEAAAKRAEKKAERAVKNEYKKQKKEEGKKAKKKEAASDTLKTVWSLLKSCKRGLNIMRSHLVFYNIKAAIAVGGEDAYEVGTSYGGICALISNGLGVLDSLFVVKQPRISIRPDFVLTRTSWDISFRVRIAPLYALAAALNILFKFLKATTENKQKREKIKGGKQHEPTTSCQ